MADVTVEPMNALCQSVYNELLIDVAPKESDEPILLNKVNQAYREVYQKRHYPHDVDSSFAAGDMQRFFSNIYNIALYDYNMRGAEGQSRIAENGEERTFIKRESLLIGVIPFAYYA